MLQGEIVEGEASEQERCGRSVVDIAVLKFIGYSLCHLLPYAEDEHRAQLRDIVGQHSAEGRICAPFGPSGHARNAFSPATLKHDLKTRLSEASSYSETGTSVVGPLTMTSICPDF